MNRLFPHSSRSSSHTQIQALVNDSESFQHEEEEEEDNELDNENNIVYDNGNEKDSDIYNDSSIMRDNIVDYDVNIEYIVKEKRASSQDIPSPSSSSISSQSNQENNQIHHHNQNQQQQQQQVNHHQSYSSHDKAEQDIKDYTSTIAAKSSALYKSSIVLPSVCHSSSSSSSPTEVTATSSNLHIFRDKYELTSSYTNECEDGEANLIRQQKFHHNQIKDKKLSQTSQDYEFSSKDTEVEKYTISSQGKTTVAHIDASTLTGTNMGPGTEKEHLNLNQSISPMIYSNSNISSSSPSLAPHPPPLSSDSVYPGITDLTCNVDNTEPRTPPPISPPRQLLATTIHKRSSSNYSSSSTSNSTLVFLSSSSSFSLRPLSLQPIGERQKSIAALVAQGVLNEASSPEYEYSSEERSKSDDQNQSRNAEPYTPSISRTYKGVQGEGNNEITFAKEQITPINQNIISSSLTNAIQAGNEHSNTAGGGGVGKSAFQVPTPSIRRQRSNSSAIQVEVSPLITAEALVKHALDQYKRENSSHLSASLLDTFFAYRLYICDDLGEVDTDFPGLDDVAVIAKTAATSFALRHKQPIDTQNTAKRILKQNQQNRHQTQEYKSNNNINSNNNEIKSNSSSPSLSPFRHRPSISFSSSLSLSHSSIIDSKSGNSHSLPPNSDGRVSPHSHSFGISSENGIDSSVEDHGCSCFSTLFQWKNWRRSTSQSSNHNRNNQSSLVNDLEKQLGPNKSKGKKRTNQAIKQNHYKERHQDDRERNRVTDVL